jgi:hypothetical protein
VTLYRLSSLLLCGALLCALAAPHTSHTPPTLPEDMDINMDIDMGVDIDMGGGVGVGVGVGVGGGMGGGVGMGVGVGGPLGRVNLGPAGLWEGAWPLRLLNSLLGRCLKPIKPSSNSVFLTYLHTTYVSFILNIPSTI